MLQAERGQSQIPLIGRSPAILRVAGQLRKAAATDVPVLITGESGTGKELAARLLHQGSSRAEGPLVKVNCPAMAGPDFEAEFLGCASAALGPAEDARRGRLAQADSGTLFLDEIGELDPSLQSKLLQALQDLRITRLSDAPEHAASIRLICATTRDLANEVSRGRFRADLFYRVNVVHIEMPPLRARSSDVPLLLNFYLHRYCKQMGRGLTPLSDDLVKLLECYHWPGNVRELENLAKRYVVLEDEEQILAALREPRAGAARSEDLFDLGAPLKVQTKRAVQDLERRIILGVLQANHWNRRKAARSLEISYRGLLYKIKEAGLPQIRPNKPSPAVLGDDLLPSGTPESV